MVRYNEMKADVFFSPSFNVDDIHKKFSSKIESNILYCSSLKKEEIYDLETHFIVESEKTDVEYMKFIFIDAKGNEKVVIKNKDDFTYAGRKFV